MTPARARLLLGVDATASRGQIEAAFRRRAWSLHPDRGGNATQFADVAAARTLLLGHVSAPASPAGARATSAVSVVSDAALLRQLVAGALGRWVGRYTASRRRPSTGRRVQ